jgi:hypothetical protein
MPWISIASSHGDKEVKILTRAFKNIIPKLKKIIDRDINKIKFKNIIKPVFRKYN